MHSAKSSRNLGHERLELRTFAGGAGSRKRQRDRDFLCDAAGRWSQNNNARGKEVLYAAQSFAEMPNNRRVQIGWGRIAEGGMPFSQMMLFPTEFNLRTTKDGLRLLATPIEEIDQLHKRRHVWTSIDITEVDQKISNIHTELLHVKAQIDLKENSNLMIRYRQQPLVTLQSVDFENGRVSVEVLIDRCVVEIFVDGGRRYIIREIETATSRPGLEFTSAEKGSVLNRLEVYEMKSIWD